MVDQINHQDLAESRLATQYKNSTNLIKSIRAYLAEANSLEEMFQSLLNDRWIDEATGFTLEVLGVIVGQPRVLLDANDVDYFGFEGDAQSNSFGTATDVTIGGRFRAADESTTGLRELSDAEYRIFIKGKILKNKTIGTIQEIIDQIKTLFPQIGAVIIEEDFSVEAAHYAVSFDRALDGNAELLIGNTNLIIKPIGVSVEYFFNKQWDNFDSQVISNLNVPDITTLNETTIVLCDRLNSKITIYEYISDEWDISTEITTETREFGWEIEALSETQFVVSYNNLKQQLGNSLDLSVSIARISAIDSQAVALTSPSLGTGLRGYIWDGSDWILGGVIGGFTFINNTALDSSNVAVSRADGPTAQLVTYSWNGLDFTQVGNPFTVPEPAIQMVTLDSSVIAYIQDTTGDLLVYFWDGTDWFLAGNPFTDGATGLSALNSTTVVTLGSGNQLKTLVWDGTDWTQVGNTLEISGILFPSITTIDESNIIIADTNLDEFRNYYWDGTDWTAGTNAVTSLGGGDKRISMLDGGSFAYFDSDTELLETYQFSIIGVQLYERDGASINKVGTFFPNDTTGFGFNIALARLSSNRVASSTSSPAQLVTLEFDGLRWKIIGDVLGSLPSDVRSLTTISPNVVAMATRTNLNENFEDALRTFRWTGSQWESVGNSFPLDINDPKITTLQNNVIALTDSLNNDLDVYFWDGVNWNKTWETFSPVESGRKGITALDFSTVVIVDDAGATDNINNYRLEGF
jgi:hypothetical protein